MLKNKVRKFLMEFHENKKRKEMMWQEEVLALQELKQIHEKTCGWVKERERTDLTVSTVNTVGRYSQEKFAEELGVSQPKISMDLELAEALKQNSDFWKIETRKAAYHSCYGKFWMEFILMYGKT